LPTTEVPSTADRHLALGVDHPADGPDRGGLARSVGAEDDHDLPGLDREGQAPQHLDRAVPGLEVGDVEERRHQLVVPR
jgi:hypothetical protein